MPKINTYTDNASIENDDKLLTYDTQAAATKLTAFSTIWTWIQNKFNALTKQTAIAAADQLLMVKNGNATGRIDYNVLAKAIIEQYAGSTLAGSNQSLQAAITALNSKPGIVCTNTATQAQWQIAFGTNTVLWITYYKDTKMMTINAVVDEAWLGTNKTIAQF